MEDRSNLPGELFLKEPTLDDLQFIQWLWGDPDTMAPVGGPVALDDQQARAWFARMISPGSPEDTYRLILKSDGTPVGEVSCHRLDLETMTADLNIKIAARYRGNGYAKQALSLFLDYFFLELGGKILQDKVAKGNQDGRNFLLAFGFKEGAPGEEYDLLVFSKKDYQDFHQPGN